MRKYLNYAILLLLLMSVFNSTYGQSFNIVSKDVQKQRNEEAARKAAEKKRNAIAASNKAYAAKVNKAWKTATQTNTQASYEVFLAKKLSTNHNATAIKKAYEFVEKKNTVSAYENFLAKRYNNSELTKKSMEAICELTPNTIKAYEELLAKRILLKKYAYEIVSEIYQLTAELDAVEGYRDFLHKYPKHPSATKVTERLYEIMYAIAEEENDIASYYGFLVQFPKSQVMLRDKAFINMQMLEVEKATDEYNLKKEKDNDHELKERAARQLYVEAIRAKESGDNYTFMRKYNTVLYSDLFKDTQAAFDLFRDKELAKLIRELRDEIRNVNYSVNRMASALTSKLNDIQNNLSSLQSTVSSSQNDYSSYFERMIDVQSSQANDWAKWATDGTKPSGFLGSPNSY